MQSDLLTLMLKGLRATIVAMLAQLDAIIELSKGTEVVREMAVAEKPGECSHPENQRLKCATFDQPGLWICRLCGYNGEA